MEVLTGMGLDLQLAGANPFYEFVDASLNNLAVRGLFKFAKNFIDDLFLRRCVGPE